VATLNELLGSSLEADRAPARVGDVQHSWADISAARDLLGFHPVVEFEEGLRLTTESLEGVLSETVHP
jgi:UDP-glucose 4-epimerase